ncbi:MAG: ROK family protein [Methanomicrobiales archaeon]|nr:ROK family protein [Methanomicrobiales archaeon]
MPLGIAIDLGATHTRAGLIDRSGQILHRVSTPTPHQDIARFLLSLIRNVATEEEISQAVGVGISAAGPVDIQQGVLVNPPNIPLRNIALVGPLTESLGIPVYLANDCHAGIIGEAYFGAAQETENVAYVTLSTGIGGGILSGGRIILGKKGNAAEIGHFFVDSTYNMICGCGYPGHWEGYASGRFLLSFYRAWHIHHHKTFTEIPSIPEDIFHAACEGLPNALEFMDTLGIINGRGMSDVIVAYDPELIILDGSVALHNYSHLVPLMEEHIDRFLPLPEIRLSSLDGDAPLLGASILAYGYDTSIGSLNEGGTFLFERKSEKGT